MKVPKRYTVTAALPYTNGPIHLGHLAGVFIPADIYCRYLRDKGADVLFVGGSDEHGVPITLQAQKEGIAPQELVDRYHQIIKKSFEDLDISFDIYSRTSAEIHHETASEFFENLYDSGKLNEKVTEQYYDAEKHQFLADRYIRGKCPNCSYEEAYGDQCENCGRSLSPEELIDPRSVLSGGKLVKKSTKHWFIPLDHYQEALEEWILSGHKEWKNNVYGQCKSWLKSGDGLKPRAVTRDLDWGVHVPIAEVKGKVLYVWFDAPIGYISATKEWAKAKNKDWEVWWKDQDSKLVHFIGKDNIVFHCIMFPAMLMAHGDYILPDNVPANEFLNLEGKKLSTSRNWAVWLPDYLEDFPGKQDVLRYVLCSILPETKDSDFTWHDFLEKNNNELVANLGNFINRVLVLCHKYVDGALPSKGKRTEHDELLEDAVKKAPTEIGELIERYQFREALFKFMQLSSIGNEYLARTEPWHLAKDPENEDQVQRVMHNCLQLVANLAILSEPFLPNASRKLKGWLGMENESWLQAGRTDILPVGRNISKGSLLFEKLEESIVEEQREKLEAQSEANKKMVFKDDISFETFSSLDLRVATILNAERVPKTDKLLQIRLDLGGEQRTVVSGIAEYHDPNELPGKQVTLLANLAPRKIRGIISQGMILMAEDADGKLVFVHPSEAVSQGSSIS